MDTRWVLGILFLFVPVSRPTFTIRSAPVGNCSLLLAPQGPPCRPPTRRCLSCPMVKRPGRRKSRRWKAPLRACGPAAFSATGLAATLGPRCALVIPTLGRGGILSCGATRAAPEKGSLGGECPQPARGGSRVTDMNNKLFISGCCSPLVFCVASLEPEGC